MSNQDSGDRRPFGRHTQLTSSSGLKSESGYKTPGKTDDDPPVVSGRGRMFAALQAQDKPKEDTSSSSSPAAATMGRCRFLSMLQSGSLVDPTGRAAVDPSTSSDEQRRNIGGETKRPETGGRGKFMAMLSTPKGQPEQQAPQGAPVGRGRIMSLITGTQPPASQQQPSAQPPREAGEEAEVRSTTDALAQLRLRLKEESQSSGSAKAPTLKQLEQEAAMIEEYVPEVVEARSGQCGARIPALTNYIRLQVDKDKGVFEYEARFDPPVHSNQLRFKLMNQLRDTIGGTKTFDGVKLCLPSLLRERVAQLTSTNPNDNTPVTVTLIYKGRKTFAECQQLYGILFANIMKILKFVRFGTKDFDPSEPKIIPQHKLEIWPGYVTAVEECHGGVMLCVDVTHRVLRQTAVIEILQHAYRNARGNMEEFQKKCATALIGAMVLTRYNNKTYRIDWDQTPMNTFQTKTGEVSYVQYYKTQYGIDIKDLKQPLLISREEKRVSGQQEKVTFTFSIIPEISYLTGLTDEQRADFKIMKDVGTFTRISPNQRKNELVKFCRRVNECPETRQLLANWGLTLLNDAVSLEVRLMDEERVIFANNKTFGVGPNADFGKYCNNNEQMCVVSLHNWLLIHVKNDAKAAKAFVECMERNSRPMGIQVSKPKIVILDNDKTDTYAATLRQALNVQTQIVVCICPTARDDRYAAIKKICCAESPIPSQVINARTI